MKLYMHNPQKFTGSGPVLDHDHPTPQSKTSYKEKTHRQKEKSGLFTQSIT